MRFGNKCWRALAVIAVIAIILVLTPVPDKVIAPAEVERYVLPVPFEFRSETKCQVLKWEPVAGVVYLMCPPEDFWAPVFLFMVGVAIEDDHLDYQLAAGKVVQVGQQMPEGKLKLKLKKGKKRGWYRFQVDGFAFGERKRDD